MEGCAASAIAELLPLPLPNRQRLIGVRVLVTGGDEGEVVALERNGWTSKEIYWSMKFNLYVMEEGEDEGKE